MTIPAELPAPVARFLGDFVGRSRRLRVMRAFGLAACLFIGWAVVCCVVDRILKLSATSRAVLLAIGLAASLTLISRALLFLRRRPNWVAVAAAAEQANPRFAQKLVTVTSQSLARPEQRGSDQILARLIDEVALGIRSKEPSRTPGLTQAIAPWLAVLGFSILAAAAGNVPSFHGSQLATRFLEPFANVPPVTTTQLHVSPGDVDLVQSLPQVIRVDAQNLGDVPPNLVIQGESRAWATIPLTPAGDGSYVFTIGSVDRDQRYYVSGGDAKSPEYQIRVLRRPAVARFDLLYEYPAYTRLRPGSFHNEDGRIEAPIGTRVTVTITATEPLKQATLIDGNERLVMTIAKPPTSAQVQLVAQSNHEYSIEMVSDREVQGATSSPCTIRVLPDLPPQVRLLRGGDSLRFKARDIIPVSYDALDDYGIVSLKLRADVNGAMASVRDLKISGDARRQQETTSFDLAKLQLAYGDALTLTLIATDTGGHESRATPLQALIAPQAVDLDSYSRILELEHSMQLEGDVKAQLARAQLLLSAAATQPSQQAGGVRFDREVTGAIQSATMLKQSLLRAVAHSDDSKFSELLGNWVDDNELVISSLQDLFRHRGGATSQPSNAPTLDEQIQNVVRAEKQIKTILDYERAQTLHIDLQNLSAARMRPTERDENARQRAATTLERMQQNIADEARQLGLSPDTRDLAERVSATLSDGLRLLEASHPVTFGSATVAWAQGAKGDASRRGGLEARLSAAAQTEAVRPDADLTRARDLELAGRAVATTRMNAAADPSTLSAIAGAIRMLADRRERTGGLHPTTMPAAELLTLAAARTILRRAANEFDERTPDADVPVEGQRDLESLAIAASAASAGRQYQRASDIESQLYRRLRSRFRRDRASGAKSQPGEDAQGPLPDRIERRREVAQRETDAARRLDDLDQRQQILTQSIDGDPLELAQRQRGVADELATIGQSDGQSAASTPDGRDRATAEVLADIEQLAAMPQVLADAQSAAESRRSAATRVRRSQLAATRAAPADRDVLERVAEGAKAGLTAAANRFASAAARLAAPRVQAMAQRLGAFAPETDAARDLILVRLEPALADLQDSLAGDDPADTDRASGEALDAISATQRELAASRDLLMRSDPLAAARSFARLAADSLAASPPNLNSAKRHQARVFESISRAWDQSIHRAAQQRLASIPSMAAVLGSPMAGESTASSRPADRFSTARQWDRMRSDDDANLDLTLHDSEPAGYEQSLKLYFEALGRAQERK